MLTCPHCHCDIDLKTLPHPGMFANYRVCPDCGERFTQDRDTKVRQYLFLLVALISLVFTLLLYFDSNDWLLPSIMSYIAVGGLMYWGNRNVLLVPYEGKDGAS